MIYFISRILALYFAFRLLRLPVAATVRFASFLRCCNCATAAASARLFSPLFICQFGILIWFANLVLLSTLICRKKLLGRELSPVLLTVCRVCLLWRNVCFVPLERSCLSVRVRAVFVFFERRRAGSFVFIKHNNQLELKARSGAGLLFRGVAERGFRAFFKA